MLSALEYYAWFVNTYLVNAVDKYRAAQTVEGQPAPVGQMARMNAVASIVFSAMTLEAFSNFCLKHSPEGEASRESVEEALQSPRAADRWRTLFRLKDRDYLSRITGDWARYLQLIRLRRALVHALEVDKMPYFNPIESLASADARKALEIVGTMMRHGIGLFHVIIPPECYDPATFEPALSRFYPREKVPLCRIVGESLRPLESGIASFTATAPAIYREGFQMADLVPPGGLPILSIRPIYFSAASNDGLASIQCVGYDVSPLMHGG